MGGGGGHCFSTFQIKQLIIGHLGVTPVDTLHCTHLGRGGGGSNWNLGGS